MYTNVDQLEIWCAIIVTFGVARFKLIEERYIYILQASFVAGSCCARANAENRKRDTFPTTSHEREYFQSDRRSGWNGP